MRKSFACLFVTLILAFAGAWQTIAAQELPKSAAPRQTLDANLPTVFLIGDSTVSNSTGDFVGWGNVIADYFDQTKINVANRARGGRSSRTFHTEGLWEKVLLEVKKGDFVLIQFGHNDGGSIDKEKARGSLKGTGDDSQEIIVEATGKKETVRTFGWYMRKFVQDAKAKGATAIVLSPVPRNKWKNGKVVRAADDYGKWAAETAKTENVLFVDLNEIVAQKYEAEKPEIVAANYFTDKGQTHTSAAGARLNAVAVIAGLKNLKNNPLGKYLQAKPVESKTAAAAGKIN